ncbi:hypothetical protein B0H11DRAFT_2143194 [Mycena galericulata]|nr:hypothetical protein B0H11DRAFT_2143194 [Mycena galericulata]
MSPWGYAACSTNATSSSSRTEYGDARTFQVQDDVSVARRRIAHHGLCARRNEWAGAVAHARGEHTSQAQQGRRAYGGTWGRGGEAMPGASYRASAQSWTATVEAPKSVRHTSSMAAASVWDWSVNSAWARCTKWAERGCIQGTEEGRNRHRISGSRNRKRVQGRTEEAEGKQSPSGKEKPPSMPRAQKALAVFWRSQGEL